MPDETIKSTTAMSALCIYEHILEEISLFERKAEGAHPFWKDVQEHEGAYALRQKAIDLAPLLDSAWDAIHPELFDDSYDWDYVPTILEAARDKDGDKFLTWDEETWKAFALNLFGEDGWAGACNDEIANFTNGHRRKPRSAPRLQAGEEAPSNLECLNDRKGCRLCSVEAPSFPRQRQPTAEGGEDVHRIARGAPELF